MSATEIYLLILIVPALIGAVVSLLPGDRVKVSRIVLILCAVSCVTGVSAYFASTILPLERFTFDWGPLNGAYAMRFDSLSTAMLSVSSVVYLATVIHLFVSPDALGGRLCGLVNVLFIAVALAMCADSVILVLVAWEMVTLTTYLMTAGAEEDHRWRYFVITHLGGLVVMSVFSAMWVMYGTGTLSEMSGTGVVLDSLVSAVLIILLFIGFGTKLGLVPFHSWMPDLYATAPVHSVTLLSTVCSNVAVLLLVKSVFEWIGVPNNQFLPLVIIVLASVGSIWGAMASLVQTEPRRTLAYSSMENMSMVMLCLGMAILFQSEFEGKLTALMIAAALLHTINHSVFKALMLLNVGTVERLTGEHVISRMGGIALFLPLLSLFAVVGTLSMAAIPPFNGFVSEWLMIKTVITAGTGTSVLNIVLPLVVAVLGITGTMAAVSYARLYGFMFLGRSRSESITGCRKMPGSVAVPLAVLSIGCVVLGVFAVPVLNTILDAVSGTLDVEHVDPSLVSDSINPAMIAVAVALIAVVVYILFRLMSKKKRSTPTWDCGRPLNKDMQYSSEGFSQPLVKVFHPVYGDASSTKDVTGGTDTFETSFTEPFNKHILNPVGRSVKALSSVVDRLQNGSIQSYLAYLLITLIVVLLAVRFL